MGYFLLFLALFSRPCWGQWEPNVVGSRSAIVHLFEWKWSDIARECEDFLGPKGFGGVQTSPPNENVVARNGYIVRPWWERYQPVSYKLETRSGSEQDFIDMVRRCNNANVRVYPDIVINHMTGGWPQGTPATGGSSFNSDTLDYPGVPFSAYDFHGPNECPTASGDIESYQDPVQVRNCRLVGLRDLKHEAEYVREKIVEYLNRLIGYGVAGFRIDASKHMWPGDLENMLGRLNDLNTEFFAPGSRAFIFMEVIDLGGEPISSDEYTYIGRVTEFKYGKFLGEVWRKMNELQWLGNFGEGWGMQPGGSVVVFIDNHDNQRGHGAGGQNILTFRVSRMYKMATAYMLAWPYGFPRIMSSYYWDQDWQGGQDKNDWVGPPMDGNENTLDVSINADGTCGNGWMCEHRWRQIYNMVAFRNAAGGSTVENFVTGTAHQIAFARSGKGFIAINNDDGASWTGSFATTLPAGDYCDVISGSKENGGCTGKTITVDGSGMAYIDISASEEDPMVAIHVDAKL